MAATTLRGDQVRAGTLPLSALVSGYQIPSANLVDGANFLKKDGSVAMTAAFNYGGFKATNQADGTVASDSATFGQLSAVLAGLATRRVRGVITANQTLTGAVTADGVVYATTDRTLLTAQTTGSQNGPWVVNTAGAWTRPTDWAAASSQKSTIFFVEEGTTNHDTRWNVVSDAITVDTTAITVSQDLSGTSYSGAGVINVSGNTITLNFGQGVENDGSNNLRVKLDGSSLARSANGLKLTPGTSGQLLVSNGTDMLPVSMSGDATISSTGVVTVATANTVKWSNLIAQEVPSGTANGANPTFTLANTPKWLFVVLNGDVLKIGAGNDFTISSNTLTMLGSSIPVALDNFFVMYGF